MKKQVVFTFKLVLLWIVFFMVQRVLFYIHYSADFDVDLNILLYLPYHSLRIDVSSFCYLMGLPFIFVMFSVLNFSEKWDKICFTISKTLIWILAVLTSVLFSSELVSYYEWRAKLSSKIFIHFKTPSEVFRTSSGSSTWWFLLYFVIQIVVFYVLYKVLLSTKKDKIINRPNLINRLVYFFVFMFCFFFLLI